VCLVVVVVVLKRDQHMNFSIRPHAKTNGKLEEIKTRKKIVNGKAMDCVSEIHLILRLSRFDGL
jgi:hypothetical protein